MNQLLSDIIAKPIAAGQLAGITAAVSTPANQHWLGASGEVTAGSGQMMAHDTVIWIASMTKAITGAAVMQLVERNDLDLDAAASRWVEELRGLQVLEGFSSSDVPIYRPCASEPTVRQLLTHTSGFGYDMWSKRLQRLSQQHAAAESGDVLVEPLLFDPGTDWAYGTGIDWAGRVVEEITGQRLGEYFEEHIFAPLKMTSTGFEITENMRARLAPVHVRDGQGGMIATDFEIEQNPKHEMGGGGLYSTPDDYLKFCRALLGGGVLEQKRILAAETVQLMAGNHMGSMLMRDLASSAPELTNDLSFFPGVDKNWGLTFMRNEQPTEHGRSAGTLSWAGLANSYFWIDLVGRTAGIWATQLFPFNDDAARENFYEFESAVRGSI